MSEPEIYYDGSYDEPVQIGATIRAADAEFRCYYLVQVFQQRASEFSKLTIGETLTYKGGTYYLTEETEPQPVIGDVIEWKRIYWQVPPPLIERRDYLWSIQWIVPMGWSHGILETPYKTTATYTREFFVPTDLEEVTFAKAKRYKRYGTMIYEIGDDPDICEDETIEQFKGVIYSRLRISAEKPTLEEAVLGD